MSIDNRLDGILKFKEENPGIDPNLFELADVAVQTLGMLRKEAPNYGVHEMPERYSEQRQTLMKYRKLQTNNAQALLENDLGVDKDSSLYKMIENLGCNVSSYIDIPEYYPRLMGVRLYIAQQERAVRRGEQDKVVFDNERELNEIRSGISRVYERVLEQKKLTDITYPELDVYNEVFEIYINSIDRDEQAFEMSSEYYTVEENLKQGNPTKTPSEIRAEEEAKEKERIRAELEAQEIENTKKINSISALGENLKGLVNPDSDFVKGIRGLGEKIQTKINDFREK